MITDFTNKLPYKSKIINIREFPFTAGCLGCFNCAGDGKCIHKDNFDQYLRENIQTCDAIVIAFTIKDHSMGARFKLYDDRQFCNGHRTVTEGMPFAYIINGNYEGEHNLKTIVEGRAEVGCCSRVRRLRTDRKEQPRHQRRGQEVHLRAADG